MYFIAGEENKAEKRINNPRFRTKLTGYFDLCRDDPNARKYKYAEIERVHVARSTIWRVCVEIRAALATTARWTAHWLHLPSQQEEV